MGFFLGTPSPPALSEAGAAVGNPVSPCSSPSVSFWFSLGPFGISERERPPGFPRTGVGEAPWLLEKVCY